MGIKLSTDESRTHFAAWCIVSAPLILGFDMANETLRRELLPIVTNARAVRVNQAWAGHAGRIVAESNSTFQGVTHHGAEDVPDPVHYPYPFWQLWAKPLPEGSAAALLINLHDEPLPSPVRVTPQDLGLASGVPLCVTDVWSGVRWTLPADDALELPRAGDPPLEAHASSFVTLTPGGNCPDS